VREKLTRRLGRLRWRRGIAEGTRWFLCSRLNRHFALAGLKHSLLMCYLAFETRAHLPAASMFGEGPVAYLECGGVIAVNVFIFEFFWWLAFATWAISGTAVSGSRELVGPRDRIAGHER
jgi:hypothetical protein